MTVLRKDSIDKQKKPIVFVAILLVSIVVAAIIFNTIAHGAFLSRSNIIIIISHATYPSFIAWAISFLFACGYNDLSLGGILVLSAFASSILGNFYGYPGVIIGGIITATVLLFINFNIFAFTKIPSWIAGISLAMIYEALAFALKVGESTKRLIQTDLSSDYRILGQMPWSVIILLVGMIITYLIYTRTTVGFNIRAIGGDARVAKALGVNITKTLLFVGIISGSLIGIASVIQISYVGRINVMTGLTSIYVIFQPIAIVLLAQILAKRININIAIPLCAVIIYAVFNLLTILHVPSGTMQEAVLGAFLIIFGIIGRRGYKGDAE
jgi:ribose transport system permease protein